MLSMRKIQEVLRLSQEQKLSVRAIARSCCVARSTAADYLGWARASGVSWPLSVGMDEDQLEKRLFPVPESETTPTRAPLDMVYIRHELSIGTRKKRQEETRKKRGHIYIFNNLVDGGWANRKHRGQKHRGHIYAFNN